MKLRKLMCCRPMQPFRICRRGLRRRCDLSGSRTRLNTRPRPAGRSRLRPTAGSPAWRATSVPAGRTTHVDESIGDILDNLDIAVHGGGRGALRAVRRLHGPRLRSAVRLRRHAVRHSGKQRRFHHAEPDVDGRRRISPARPAGCQRRRLRRLPAVLHRERARLQPARPARRSRAVADGNLGRSDRRIEGARFDHARSSI